MGKFVVDYLTKDEIFISEKRHKRPHSYTAMKNKDYEEISKKNCPFCEKSNAIPYVISEKNDIRVIPNKYPVASEDDGIHEVLVESKNHCLKFYEDKDENCIDVFKMLQERYNILIKKHNTVVIFKNEGLLSGASLYHSHWQILAINNPTPRNRKIYNSFCEFKNETNKDFFSKTNEEILVYKETENIVAYVPKYIKTNLQTRLYTKRKVSSFGLLTEYELKDLAVTVKEILLVYKSVFTDFSYNILFNDFDNRENGHFYIEVLPRLGKFGGFELCSESYITSSTGKESVEIFKNYFTGV